MYYPFPFLVKNVLQKIVMRKLQHTNNQLNPSMGLSLVLGRVKG